jgi:hypothetical protein
MRWLSPACIAPERAEAAYFSVRPTQALGKSFGYSALQFFFSSGHRVAAKTSIYVLSLFVHADVVLLSPSLFLRVIFLVDFDVDLCREKAGRIFESPDQKIRGFVVQIALPRWILEHTHQVFREMSVRI